MQGNVRAGADQMRARADSDKRLGHTAEHTFDSRRFADGVDFLRTVNSRRLGEFDVEIIHGTR